MSTKSHMKDMKGKRKHFTLESCMSGTWHPLFHTTLFRWTFFSFWMSKERWNYILKHIELGKLDWSLNLCGSNFKVHFSSPICYHAILYNDNNFHGKGSHHMIFPEELRILWWKCSDSFLMRITEDHITSGSIYENIHSISLSCPWKGVV